MAGSKKLDLEVPAASQQDGNSFLRAINRSFLRIADFLQNINIPDSFFTFNEKDNSVSIGNRRLADLAPPKDENDAVNLAFGDWRWLRRERSQDQGAKNKARLLTVTLPSVREDDIGLRAKLKESITSARDLKEIKVIMTGAEGSRLGDSFQPGDFFLYNDGGEGKERYRYEINRLIRIILPKATDDLSVPIRWIVQRVPPKPDPTDFDIVIGDTERQAWFGSTLDAHPAKTMLFKVQIKREYFDIEDVAGVPSFQTKHFKNGVVTIDDLKFGPPDPELAKAEAEKQAAVDANKQPSDELLAKLDGLRVIEHDRAHSLDIDWSHRCILAAIVQLDDSKTEKTTQSLIPKVGEKKDPVHPGLRTHSGASYTLVRSGDLAVGDRLRVPIHVAEWPAFRCIYAYLKTAPVGATNFGTSPSATAFTLDVVYVAPPDVANSDGDRIASVIQRLVWQDNTNYSYPISDPPDGHEMPYAKWGPLAWPTTLLFGKEGIDDLVADLDPSADPDTTQIVQQDGYFDFIVRQIGGTTPGAGLCLEILL